VASGALVAGSWLYGAAYLSNPLFTFVLASCKKSSQNSKDLLNSGRHAVLWSLARPLAVVQDQVAVQPGLGGRYGGVLQ